MTADFESILASEIDTPNGGRIRFGVGALRFADGHDEPAIAMQIMSPTAAAPDFISVQFALRFVTFAALLGCMKDVLQQAQQMGKQA